MTDYDHRWHNEKNEPLEEITAVRESDFNELKALSTLLALLRLEFLELIGVLTQAKEKPDSNKQIYKNRIGKYEILVTCGVVDLRSSDVARA